MKRVETGLLARRFPVLLRTPDKALELRASRPRSRWDDLPVVAGGVMGVFPKVRRQTRPNRFRKLRFFRVFKLFGALKAATEVSSTVPIVPRLRRPSRALAFTSDRRPIQL